MIRLDTVREINEACKTGGVKLARKNGSLTGSTIYHARTQKGVLQAQLRRGDTGKGYWVNLSETFIAYREEKSV